MRKLRKNPEISKILRSIRKSKKMPLEVVIEELKDLKVHCSMSNLAKIERGIITCRADILGALSVIYEVDPKEILFEKK